MVSIEKSTSSKECDVCKHVQDVHSSQSSRGVGLEGSDRILHQ
jgi:hypothetical protein